VPDIRIGRQSQYSPVLAFADDVIIFITRPCDFQIVKQAITIFEKASGAKMNATKSQALSVGRWTHPPSLLGMGLQTQARILGVDFQASTHSAAIDNWNKVIHSVRAQATTTYHRHLDFAQRILFIQTYLLAKIWYIAQVFPVTRQQAQRITTICTWYLWHGAIFRVPVTTLYLPKSEGGWDLPHVEGKCLAVLYNRLHKLHKTTSSITGALMDLFQIDTAAKNPPHVNGIPRPFLYFRQYAATMAYQQPAPPSETPRQLKKRLYANILTMHRRDTPTHHVRIHEKHPHAKWRRVWTNVHHAHTSAHIKAAWYLVIHDVITNNSRLHTIRLTDSPNCTHCGREDTTHHKLTECTETRVIWNVTRTAIASIMRTSGRNVPSHWATRPDFKLWPNQKHQAVVWILAHHMQYVLRTRSHMSMVDYLDFMRRARWKLYRAGPQPRPTGNYLMVLDDDFTANNDGT
jgi:hypothetical protein